MKRIAKITGITATILILTLLLGIVSSRTVRASVTSLIVTIANTSANPVPTLAVDNPARQAVVITTNPINPVVVSGAGSTSAYLSDANGTYTVPAGYRLVIESISGQMNLPAGSGQSPSYFQVLTYVNGATGLHDFAPTYISSNASYDFYAFTAPLATYADAGTQIQMDCGRGPSNAGLAICSATISGHLASVQ